MQKRKGFTLVELLVILAIIAVVASVAVPLILNMQSHAESADLENTITQVELAMKQYKVSGSKTATGLDKLSNENDGLFISEQQIFLDNAGKGLLPGGQLQNTDIVDVTATMNDVAYDLIRKEAIVAVKGFTNLRVIDTEEDPKHNYFLDVKVPEGMAIVYNYLNGKVSLENINEMESKQVVGEDGVVDISAFYVYLTKPGGNGMEISGGGGLIPQNPDEDDETYLGSFYLRVVDWATKEALSDVSVDLYNGIEHREFKTDSSGYLLLNKTFKYGEYVLTLEKAGYVTYFDDVIYSNQHNNAEIVVTKDGYLGDSALNVYNVELVNVTRGKIDFTRKTQEFNKVSEKWVESIAPLNKGILTVTFTPDASDLSAAQSERYVSYTVDLGKTGGVLDLFTKIGGEQKTLTFGNYIMTVDLETEPKIRTLVKKVYVNEYGIDERDVSQRQFIGNKTFYTYTQELKTLTTEIKGNISSNMDLTKQPLETSGVKEGVTAITYWNFEEVAPKAVKTFVELWQDGVLAYSGELDESGNYSITGVVDGNYDIYVRNEFNSKFQPSNIAYKLKAEGYESKLDMVVAESDYPEVDVTFTLKFPDGSPITTNYEVKKFGVTGLTNPVKSGILTNGTDTFKLKTGIYQFTYTKPYAKTEDNFKSYVLVTDKGEVVNAIYKQINSRLNVVTKFNNEVITLPTDMGMKVVLTCTDSGNKASPVSVKVDERGAGVASVKPGNYKYTVTFDKHYKTIEGTIALFDKNLNWLTPYTTTLNLELSYDEALDKHSALIYESVTEKTHLQHCTLCGYKNEPVDCTFDGKREVPIDDNAKTHHYTYCSVCDINKELQVHIFEGEYKPVDEITGKDTGTHYRKCTTCDAYGLQGIKDTTEKCTLKIKSIEQTTHTYTCEKCNNTKAITHDYTGDYVIVKQSTKDEAGTHARKCLYCESVGIGNVKDAVETCTMSTTSCTETEHIRICLVCNKNTFKGNHEWGEYLIVEQKTSTNEGKHNRKCWICEGYEATAVCKTVEDLENVTSSTHRYTCTDCNNYFDYNHNFTGDYKIVKVGADGLHNRKCLGCSQYGMGSGNTAKKDNVEACVYDTFISTGETQHKSICDKCKNVRIDNHEFGDYEIETAKTTATDGKHKRTCEKCDYIEIKNCDSEIINKEESTDTHHICKCSKCGNSAEVEHVWETIETTATTVTKKCTVCEKVITVDNHPPTTPVINPFPKTDSNTIKLGRAMTLTATSTDPDGDEITYEWEGRIAETSSAYTVGTHTVKCRAKDANGAYSSWASYTFTVKNAAAVTLQVLNSSSTNFDIHGTVTSSGTDLRTTFSNQGYTTAFKVGSNVSSGVGTSATLDGVTLTRIIDFDEAMNMAKISYVVRNTTSTSKRIGIACHTDVQIGSNDRAPIYPTSTGFRMTDGTYDFYVIGRNMSSLGVTDVDTLWWGHYGERTSHLWDGTRMSSSLTGKDSGMVIGWCNRTIPANSTRTFSFIIDIE